MDTVHEIAVRAVRAGRAEGFCTRRAAFIEELTRQRAVLADREFASVHAVVPDTDEEVFVGMTTYESLNATAAIQRRPRVLWRFVRFARTMRLQAYVYVQPVGGDAFDLAALAASPGEVLELAVRRVHDRAQYDSRRRAFVEILTAMPGTVESREFVVVKGKQRDSLAVELTVYRDAGSLEAAREATEGHPATIAFTETFEPVTVHHLASTTNH